MNDCWLGSFVELFLKKLSKTQAVENIVFSHLYFDFEEPKK